MFVVYNKNDMEVRFFENFWGVCKYIAKEVLKIDALEADEILDELYREGLLALNRSMTSLNIEIDWVEKGQPFYV